MNYNATSINLDSKEVNKMVNKTNIFRYAKYLGVGFTVIALAGATWAAFSDKGKVLGSTFSVGNSDIKLLKNIAGDASLQNLKDEIAGPNFANLTPNWTQDYLVKIYNNGSTPLQLASNSNYETANDPDDLRTYIYVEPIEWNDVNGDGIYDPGEEGLNYSAKSITKWKTEGYEMGIINIGEIKGYILRFSTTNLSDTKQGATGSFDFEINAVQI